MRRLFALVCIPLAAVAAQAQGKMASWQNLNVLQSGEKIQVLETNSTWVTGKFVSVSDTAISLQSKKGPQTIGRDQVGAVQRMKNKHRLRNALIVGGIGAGAGAGIGAAVHKGCSSTQTFCLDFGGRSWPAGIGAVIGLLGGSTVGALLPNHETIYSAGAR
jgi:hypothetical protein